MSVGPSFSLSLRQARFEIAKNSSGKAIRKEHLHLKLTLGVRSETEGIQRQNAFRYRNKEYRNIDNMNNLALNQIDIQIDILHVFFYKKPVYKKPG